MSANHIVAALVTASLASSVGAQPAQRGDITGTLFTPERRTLTVGDSAISRLAVRNSRAAPVSVWFGYSVQDAGGDWHDVDPVQVRIDGKGTHTQQMTWVLPMDQGLPAGSYRVVMAVWSARPGADGAERLASGDIRDAFRVRSNPVVVGPEGRTWRAGDHFLGRGRFRVQNVSASAAGYRLMLPARSCDGAEIRATGHSHFGEFTARMRTPSAPGSISAFFFYGSVTGANDEIDIEIYNDGSRTALLTAWHDGKKSRGAEVTLPFDPAVAMHDYTMRWSAKELVFLADSVTLARWSSGYPKEPMRLMANVWWPTWLPCTMLVDPRYLDIEHIGQRLASP